MQGVLPMVRKLGEEVIKNSSNKLHHCVNKAITVSGDSLVDYSQVLTVVYDGTTGLC